MYQSHGVHLSPVTRHLSRRSIRVYLRLIFLGFGSYPRFIRVNPRLILPVYTTLLRTVFIITATLLSTNTAQAISKHKRARIKSEKLAQTPSTSPAPPTGPIIGHRLKFVDGSSIQVDEVWKQGEEYWSRTGGVTQRVDREVRSVEPVHEITKVPSPPPIAKNEGREAPSFWIYLKDGARMKVDEVTDAGTRALYRRGNLSIFIERELISRIEREVPGAKRSGWSERGWTTGKTVIDELIRVNGARFGVDPYLIFCVIEHESHFKVGAVSPKGARGLMQLMPGTASRFGVRRSMDPAENIFGGTQYLKLLLQMFNGRVDLALASYNAGAGAVRKYGRNVPPYRETREYVKRITKRYGEDS